MGYKRGKMQNKKYGFLNNFIYAWKMAVTSNKKLMADIFMRGFFDVGRLYLWIYAPKIIISLVEQKATIKEFVIYMIVLGVCMCISDIGYRYGRNNFDFNIVKLMNYLEKRRMKKMFETDYKNMESPDFLDFGQKAKNALYHGQGFFGALYESSNIIGQGITVIVSSILIGMKNVFVMITILVMAVLVGKILGWVSERDKKKFSDYIAPTNRKINYLDRTSRNFDFQKRI